MSPKKGETTQRNTKRAIGHTQKKKKSDKIYVNYMYFLEFRIIDIPRIILIVFANLSENTYAKCFAL